MESSSSSSRTKWFPSPQEVLAVENGKRINNNNNNNNNSQEEEKQEEATTIQPHSPQACFGRKKKRPNKPNP
ncbi:hypothetical protein CsatB_015312 [Cannabis sativa]